MVAGAGIRFRVGILSADPERRTCAASLRYAAHPNLDRKLPGSETYWVSYRTWRTAVLVRAVLWHPEIAGELWVVAERGERLRDDGLTQVVSAGPWC